MRELSVTEINTLLFLVRLRLKYESQRRRKKVLNGVDAQYQKIRNYEDLITKLEEIKLAT